MGVRCDWFLLIYLQIMTINAITLPLTTTSKSIPVKPKSASSLASSSSDDCSTSPTLQDNVSLNPLLSLPDLPSKVSNPRGVTLPESNLNFQLLNESTFEPSSDSSLDSLDPCVSSSYIVTNIAVPSQKGFTSSLKLSTTTPETSTCVLVKPSLHFGTQNTENIIPSHKGSGLSVSTKMVDSSPPPNLSPVVFTESSNTPSMRPLPQQSIVKTSDGLPWTPNIQNNNLSSSVKVTSSSDITMALLNLNPMPTTNSPTLLETISLNCEPKNVDTLSLPNIVSYFFPSLPKVTALPGSTLSTFNLNPVPPVKSPNCSDIKTHENHYIPNNLDSFVLSPSPPTLVTSNVIPICYPPTDFLPQPNQDSIVSTRTVFNPADSSSGLKTQPSHNRSEASKYSSHLNNFIPATILSPSTLISSPYSLPDSANSFSSKPSSTCLSEIPKNAQPNIVSPAVVLSTNANPILTAHNDFSSSLKPETVLSPTNFGSIPPVQGKVANNKKCFSSSLTIVSNNCPSPLDSSNSGLVVNKPNLYIAHSPEMSCSKIAPQGKPDISNVFANNFEQFPNTILTPNYLPSPDLKSIVNSERFGPFYPHFLQGSSYLTEILSGSATESRPFPNNYLHLPLILTSPEKIPPKVANTFDENSKSNKIQTLSITPRISLSIPNINNVSPLLSANDPYYNVPTLETLSPCISQSHVFDLKSPLNRYPVTNKETISPHIEKNINCPNVNSMYSPLNIAPGVSMNVDITTTPCSNPVRNKVTISSRPENLINPLASDKYLSSNNPNLPAEEFPPFALPSQNFIPCPYLPRVLNTFSSKLNTVVNPPKLPDTLIPFPQVQLSRKSEMASSVTCPLTNPSTNSMNGGSPTSCSPKGTTELMPNNMPISPLGQFTPIGNVASLTHTPSSSNDNQNIIGRVPEAMSSKIPEIICQLTDSSSCKLNDIDPPYPLMPATSFVMPVIQKSSNLNNFPGADRKLASIFNSPSASYSSCPVDRVLSSTPITKFGCSETTFPSISTQPTDKIVSSINEIASSLTKDILSNILAKSLVSEIESSKSKALPPTNPFAIKLAEFEPQLSKDLLSISNNDLSPRFVSKEPVVTSPPPTDKTQINDYNDYLATSLLPDIIKALQLIIDTQSTPKEPDLAPPTLVTPYISSLTINIIPPVEESPPETHIILPSHINTEFISPIPPAYLATPTSPPYSPGLPVMLETPVVTNSFNCDSKEAKRVLDLILLSELINNDDNYNWDAMENFITLLCAS